MNQVYSKGTYWRLVLFHIIFPIVLFGILLSVSPYFLYIFYIPLGLIILSLLGIITVSLQDKNVDAGYLILINLAIEVYVWIWLLHNTLDALVKSLLGQEGQAYMWVLILLLFSIFVHVFITSSLFTLTSVRKLKTASLITLFFAVLVGGGMIFNSVNSLRPSEWNTYKDETLGYEIKYSPTLLSYGSDKTWTFVGNAGYGGDELGIEAYQSNSQSVEEWLKNEWPNTEWTSFDPYTPTFGEEGHRLFFRGQKSDWLNYFSSKTQDLFNKAENITVNNYQAVKLPTVPIIDRGHSYAVFISNGKNRVIKISCNYRDDDMKEICSEMISTLQFTDAQ